MASLTDGLDPDSPYTQVFDLGSSTGGPAWAIIPSAGIAELFTDNANRSSIDKQAAATTSLHASIAARGDTARLQAGLAYTGRYRKGLGGGARSSGFTHAGSALAHAIVIPNFLSLDVRGNARELQRVGYGNVNPDILNQSDTTQSFMTTVSPDARWRVGNVGTSDLRYSYTRLWFQRNTGQISTPTGTLGSLSGATMQLATFNLSLPNTLIDRLFTNVQVSGSDQETNRGGGGFKRASAQAINEYRLGATFSGIVTGGYESLNSPLVTGGLGQGATWDVGGRWRPNVDSSIILLYGSHDLNTSMRGMVTYQLTPLTQFYAVYTNGIGTAQGSLASSGNSAFFGLNDEDALTTGYDDDLTLGALGGGGSGFGSGFGGAGIPLGSSNFGALQNGLFRRKSFNATLTSTIIGEKFTFLAYTSERQHLSGTTAPSGGVQNLGTTGASISWSHPLTQNVPFSMQVGYHFNNVDSGKTWRVGAFTGYNFAPSLNAGLRFDSIHRSAVAGRSFSVNTLSISVTKTFE